MHHLNSKPLRLWTTGITMALIVIDICLSDIPVESRTKSEKNGKVYAKFCVADRKEPDQFGNTHTVYMNQTKEAREAQTPKHYVGNGKSVGSVQPVQAATPAPPADDFSDLPF